MHPRVLSTNAWRVVRRLVASDVLESWTLAGGTALALQLGHRYSEDLDFFGAADFDTEGVVHQLAALGKVAVQSRSAGTLHAVVDRLRVSFLRAQEPLVFPGVAYRGLNVADPRDIAAMKVVAIGGRGSRKDFVDLYFYLETGATLAGTLAVLRERFAQVDYNEYHLLKSLVYFDDAEAEPMPRMLRAVSWDAIKEAMAAEVRALS